MDSTKKYKLKQLADDFGVDVKEAAALVSDWTGKKKNQQSSLSPDEYNLFVDALTTQTAVANLMSYFARVKPVSEVKEEPKPEEKPAETPETKPEEKPEEKKEENEKPSAAETAEKSSGEKPADDKKPADGVKRSQNGSIIGGGKDKDKKKKNRDQKDQRAQQQNKPAQTGAAGQSQSPSRPFEKKQKDPDRVMQARTKGERRTIDTRTEQIQLDKYNEHYDELTPSGKGMRDNQTSKQKITQKSKQNRHQGTRMSKRETERERLQRIAEQRAQQTLKVTIPEEITVADLAALIKVRAGELIAKMMKEGLPVMSQNQTIDFETAALMAEEFGAKVEKEVVVTIEDRIIDSAEDKEEDLKPRDPVVVVMGHVDHGKTSILDAIRHTNVVSGESGGITQHIGAYRVHVHDRDITFLDTPGHEAFTAMRARGAMATDIAVLVVAADDGIMPQTIEAINHAKAANVSIIVAINKMDKPGANPDAIMQQLTNYELVPEKWGGDTICVPVSAKTGMGIEDLLDNIILMADVSELKANPDRAARGTVIESRLDTGKGPVATLLVQNGTLNAGDIVVAGTSVGKIRVMTDDRNRRIKSAGPSIPVAVMGLDSVPTAGDTFDAVTDEKLARELVEKRRREIKAEQFKAADRVTLENLFSKMEQGEVKNLNIIVKADVDGSVEAVTQNLEKLSNDEVRVRVIHGGVGAVTESDVMLAKTSDAIIIGFHVRPDPVAKQHAERDHVEMRMYMVIYDCIEDVQNAIRGMLAPKTRDVDLGRAEVRKVFNLSSAGTIAGSYVLDGKVTRNAKIRVVRDGIVVAEDSISSLKRMKDDAKEVAAGYECGIGLTKFNDIKEGDVFEAFVTEEYRD